MKSLSNAHTGKSLNAEICCKYQTMSDPVTPGHVHVCTACKCRLYFAIVQKTKRCRKACCSAPLQKQLTDQNSKRRIVRSLRNVSRATLFLLQTTEETAFQSCTYVICWKPQDPGIAGSWPGHPSYIVNACTQRD